MAFNKFYSLVASTVVVVSLTCLFGISASCPTSCSCPFNHTVDCSGRGLTAIPAGIPSDAIDLNLSNNSLSSLDFHEKFPYLVTLDVSFNTLKNLPDNLCNARVPRLKELDASNNEINTLPGGIFSWCSQLSVLKLSDNKMDPKSLLKSFRGANTIRNLDISGNRIVKLLPNDFTTLSNLLALKMARMGTKEVSNLAFNGLTNLQMLDLSSNAMSSLNSGVIEPLTSLWQMNLGGNQFLCNCALKEFKGELARRHVVFTDIVVCYVPKNEQPFNVQLTDMTRFCPAPISSTPGVISTPEPEPEHTSKPTLPPEDCKRLRPYQLIATNVTNVSAVLEWRSDCVIGGADVVINVRNIDVGLSTVETVANDVDVVVRRFPLDKLKPSTYYASCVKLTECNYETCAIFQTYAVNHRTTAFSIMTASPSDQGQPHNTSHMIIGIVVTILVVALLLGVFILLARTSDKFFYTVFKRMPRDMKMAPDLGASQSSLVVIANGRVNGAYMKNENSVRSTDENSNSTSPRSSINNQPYLQVIEADPASPGSSKGRRAGDEVSEQTDYTSLSSLEDAAARERKYEKLKPVPGQVLPGRSPVVPPQAKRMSYLKRQAYDPDYLEPRDVSSDSSGSDSPDVNDPLYVDYDQSPRPPRYSQIHNLHAQQEAPGESASSDYLKPDEINGKVDSPDRKRRPKMGVTGAERRSAALPPVPVSGKRDRPIVTHPVQRGDSTRSGTYEELSEVTLENPIENDIINTKIDEGVEPDVNVVMMF